MNMKVAKGTIKRDSNRDSYWTRVKLTSSENKNTLLLVCASHEYLGSVLNTNKFNDTRLNGWVDNVIKEWELKGNAIFRKPVHFEVKTVTEDGYKKGVEFLKQQIPASA